MGVSNVELRTFRTVLGKAFPPHAGGGILTAKLVLNGDPAADVATAPLPSCKQKSGGQTMELLVII